MKVVCKRGIDVGREAHRIDPGVLRFLPDGSILAFGVPGEKPTYIPLIRNSLLECVVVISSVEVPILGKVVINARNAKVAGLRCADSADVAAIVCTVAAATVIWH